MPPADLARPETPLVWPGAAPDDVAAPPDAAETVPPTPPAPRRLPALDLGPLAEAPYLETRAGMLEALAAARESHRAGVLIGLARLHLAHGMFPEARSFLRRAEAAGEASPVSEVLDLALRAFDPRRHDPVPAADAAPEGPDVPLFSALLAIAEGPTGPIPDFAEAIDRIDALPVALQAVALPPMLDHAVGAERWWEARKLAGRFEEIDALREGSVYHYQLGRVAEAGREDVAAFDSYLRAATGRDAAAQRARLALVALGQRTGTLEPAEAAEMLRAARRLWQGGPLGRQTLAALAAADLAAGDRVSALVVLHDILRAYPDSLDAQKARAEAEALLAQVYGEGLSGIMPLPVFMQAHQRLAEDFRMSGLFDAYSESYAGLLMSHGFTAAAAEELSVLRDHVAVAQDLGLGKAEPARDDRLRLAEAEALIAGGRPEEAVPLLAAPLGAENPELSERLLHLRASVFEASGDTEALLDATPPEPSERFLRLKADALFARESWSEAYETYRALWERAPAAMAPSRAARMLLAAHRSGSSADIGAIVDALPQLAETPHWAAIARELAADRPELLPLRQSMVEAEIADALRTVERIDSLSEPDG
ncbi:hypothetical protein RISW2_04045 [Roseivivax isoporae LMG 25204]|uniref:Tetratricopeptide repeat protein n=1 Tax=Roseivivax isoporae LMG 25204 TaxID=1449351 RepID=X7F7W0_9RHOB|nr:hypothetical protein RISW2_04045 [Roseivivax isoporae LMG 25204]